MKKYIKSSNRLRYNNLRRIVASEEVEDTRVKDMSDLLKDDFNYLLDSFDKLSRMGRVSEALDIIDVLDECINQCIQDCADQITQ